MTPSELRKIQHELGRDNDEMAKMLGISLRSYLYRLAGERPIKQLEAGHINKEIAAHRMAVSKRNGA